MNSALQDYGALLTEIKATIRSAQTRAVLSANREMIVLYWQIGRLIASRQAEGGWGAGVVPRLALDLKTELPGLKGVSKRNLFRMVKFYNNYSALPLVSVLKESLSPIVPQAVAQLPNRADLGALHPESEREPITDIGHHESTDREADLAAAILALPWGHNILLLQKVKELPTRRWYMVQAVTEGWSRSVLELMIKSQAHERQGAAITNFETCLPPTQSDLARQTLKDPYIFDFLTLERPFRERELEAGLISHLQHFMVELGVGFAFVGSQHHLTVVGDDFYLDLLFYHLKLRCYVVVELKIGPFRPEYAGKMNFYLNVVDDQLRHETDQPSIGLILCQDKKQVLAEYALRGMTQPIGVSEYELTKALPESLRSALPTIAALEAELSAAAADG